jgi:hypothetical protein
MAVASPTKQRRLPPSHKAANADLCQEVVRVWRECERNTREAARKLGLSEGGVRHYLDQAREEWKATAGASFGDAADEAEALIWEVYEAADERYHEVLRSGSAREKASAHQYLGICLRCLADLRQLRGLDAPAGKAAPRNSHFVGNPDRGPDEEPMTAERAEALFMEIVTAPNPAAAARAVPADARQAPASPPGTAGLTQAAVTTRF